MFNWNPKVGSLIIPSVLIALITYLRFSSFPLWQSFDYDQEIGLQIVKRIVVDQKIVTIGTQASVAEVFVGPYFYYLNAPVFLVTKMDPSAMIVATIFNSVVLLLAIYLIARKIFKSKVAVIALIIYGLSAYLTSFDRTWWNPMLMPLTSLLTFYGVYRFLQFNSKLWLLIAAVCSSSLIHWHLSGVIMIAFFFISLLIWGRQKLWQSKGYLLLIGVIYLLSLLPLIVFDLRNGFLNSQALLSFMFGIQNDESIKKGFTIVSRDSSIVNNLMSFILLFGAILVDHTERIVGFSLGIVIIGLIGLSYWHARFKSFLGLLFILQIGLTFLFIMFNKGSFLPYYLQSAFPITVLFLSVGIASFPRVLATVIIGAFLIVNVPTIVTFHNNLGLSYKKQALEFIKSDARNKDYVIDFVFNDPRTPLRFGFNYLFWYYDMEAKDRAAARGQYKYKIVLPASQMDYSQQTVVYGDVGVIRELTP